LVDQILILLGDLVEDELLFCERMKMGTELFELIFRHIYRLKSRPLRRARLLSLLRLRGSGRCLELSAKFAAWASFALAFWALVGEVLPELAVIHRYSVQPQRAMRSRYRLLLGE
jgi:hypothetical protein